MDYIKEPRKIENKSMAIIESEMENPGAFQRDLLPIVKRVIHTTADFDYEKLIRFKGEVVKDAFEGISRQGKIYCDTNMISVGVNRVALSSLSLQTVNFVHDDDVKKAALERGVTRSMVAIEKAFFDEEVDIYLIGNAPTALLRLLELCEEHQRYPKLIVGVPVGFVGAREAKDVLEKHDTSQIIIKGRKGGSTVAVAIMNALMKLYMEATT